MEKKINLTVDKTENELRVDIFIKKRENIISRTRIKNLILDNKLNSKLNSYIIKSSNNNNTLILKGTGFK